MDTIIRLAIAPVVAFGLASAGCAAGTSASRLPAGFAAAPACHPSGPAKVLARHVYAPGGVEATRDEDGEVSVRFAAAASRCVSVAWPHAASSREPASCPAPEERTAARAKADDETMLAWESHDEPEPHITLGVVTYDTPRAQFGIALEGQQHVVERTFYVPGGRRGGGETAPELAPIGHDRFLLAWVDGNVESRQLRMQSIVGWGDPLGPALVLSPDDASVIGRPSVDVAPSGYGLVTYVASIDGEFDVLATPIACVMN